MMRAFIAGSAVAFWVLAVPPLGSSIIPASWYVNVRAVTVLDGPAGEAPGMLIDRTIHRTFRAQRVVDIHRILDDGVVAPHCARQVVGGVPFAPADGIITLTLDDWADIPPNAECEWEAGQYQVTTEWGVNLWWGMMPRLRVTSNVFTLWAEEE